jgi:large subunit ribosomal protein L9
MQVILMEKVANLGNLGDIVKVKDGFARNFLIPQRKARRATDANRAEFEARRADLEKAAGERLAASQALAAKLDGLMVQITEKAGVDGRLFGSVTNFNIADALVKLGFEVERSQIRMPAGPIKAVGDNDIAVQLHTDVVVTIKVSVLGEAA